MKIERDAGFIRSLLDEIRSGKTNFQAMSDGVADAIGVEPIGQSREEADKLEAHLKMMRDEGLISYEGPLCGGVYFDVALT